jgi:putative phosphoribosyl transferase
MRYTPGERGESTFRDRRDAGKQLAESVSRLPDLGDAIVLGLPRGGVPVAFEVARTCNLPLDIFLVRKLGVPQEPELAMGAVASGGTVVLNASIVRSIDISEEALDAIIARERHEMERQERLYRAGRPALSLDGRTVILVDDGLATGASMRAAAQAVRPRAKQLVIAVPVGAPIICEKLRSEADLVVCPLMPEYLEAVGRYYLNFDQISDDEVRELLAAAHRTREAR